MKKFTLSILVLFSVMLTSAAAGLRISAPVNGKFQYTVGGKNFGSALDTIQIFNGKKKHAKIDLKVVKNEVKDGVLTVDYSAVNRAAIASVIPLTNPILLMDSGANLTVTSDNICQFAFMGAKYMEKIYGIDRPRVGQLNNGTEYNKGNALQVESFQLLSDSGLNFVGNVEGKEIPFDICDVLVSDGFTGNIFLKTVEGMGKFLMKTLKDVFYTNIATKVSALTMKEKIKDMKHKFDASEHGGAPILGISKPVIKAHGSSDANAIKNAVRQAIHFIESGINEDITKFAADYDEKKLLADADKVFGDFS